MLSQLNKKGFMRFLEPNLSLVFSIFKDFVPFSKSHLGVTSSCFYLMSLRFNCRGERIGMIKSHKHISEIQKLCLKPHIYFRGICD